MNVAKKKWLSFLLTICMVVSLCGAAPEAAYAASVVSKGSSGTDVYHVQYNLNFLGFSVGSVDGMAGNNTVSGIKSYQRSRHLTVDGMAGPDTQSHLKSEVREIQSGLKKLGYYNDSIDGVAGPNTIAALKKFQQSEGISRTGVADSTTITRLNTAQSAPNTTIAYSNLSVPNTTEGRGVHLDGSISSSGSRLSIIKAWVRNASGQTKLSKTVSVNTNSYSLYNSELDMAMTFGDLAAGNYTLYYEATAADGTQKSTSINFNVQANNVKQEVIINTTINYNDLSAPNTMQGNGVHLTGTIVSTGSKLAAIKAYVLDSSGRTILSKNVNVNTNSYNLYDSAIDDAMTFGALSAGNYTLRYEAITADGTNRSTNLTFTVQSVVVPTAINYSNLSAPNTTEGSGVHLDGTISSSGSRLATIKAWVTDASGQTKLSKTVNVNTNFYRLYNSDLDRAMTFGDLTAGSYTLHYEATTADGTSKNDAVDFNIKPVATKATISYSNLSAPNTTEGNGVHLDGTISTSGSRLATVKAWVTDASGQTKLSKTVNVNTNSYSLYNSDLDRAMTFGDLRAGDYTLHYEAVASDGSSGQQSISFTVSNSETSVSQDAQKIVAIAKTQVGKPISTYWKWYNGSRRKDNGCALFVSYVARQAGIDTSIIPTVAGVPGRWYKNKGLYQNSQSRGGNYIPKPGDLIFYDWGHKDGYYWHVEYVVKVSGNKVYAIGTSDSAGKIVERQFNLNSSNIMGYANVQY